MGTSHPPADLQRLLEHTAFLGRVARGLLSNPEDARDTAQETWVRALSHGTRRIRHPRGWLRTVARNLAYTRARSARTHTRHEIHLPRPTPEPSTLDVVVREELRRRVVEAVLALPDHYRRTLILRYYEGLSLREVASRTEVPLETVRTRIRRALQRLRSDLDAEERGRSSGAGWRVGLVVLSRQASPEWGAPAPVAGAAWVAASAILVAVVIGAVTLIPRVMEGLRERAAPTDTAERVTGEPLAHGNVPAAPSLHGLAHATERPALGRDDPAAKGTSPLASSAKALVARDMLDGAVQPRLVPVTWAEGSPLLPALAESGAWHAVGEERDALRRGVLWVLQTIDVHARIEDEDGRALPEGATLTMRRIGSHDARRYRPSGLDDHDHKLACQLVSGLPQPKAGREAHALLIPRVRGVVVTASAPGYLSAWQLVEPTTQGKRIDLSFRLRPGPVLHGQLLDEAGSPLAGAEVLVRVVVPAPYERPALDVMVVGVPWGCFVAGGRRDPRARFTFQTAVDDDGRFRVDLPIQGEVVVRAWMDGRVAAERALGILPPGPRTIELALQAERADAPTHVEIRRADGALLEDKGAPIHVMKIERSAVTRIWTLEPDRPLLPRAELERWAHYLVTRGPRVGGQVLGRFVWDEVAPIVLVEEGDS